MNDPYAGQYPPPKPAVKSIESINESFYMIGPHNNNNNNNITTTHSLGSRISNDSRSKSSSLPLSSSNQSRQSESTIVSMNQAYFQNNENKKSNYYDPEAINLREYLEAEREERLRLKKEIEMELRYSYNQSPTKIETAYFPPNSNKVAPPSDQSLGRKGSHNQCVKNEKYNYRRRRSCSCWSILGMLLLIFLLLVGVGLIVADKIINIRCTCDDCIECSRTFHLGMFYSGIGVLALSGSIIGFKVLRRICC